MQSISVPSLHILPLVDTSPDTNIDAGAGDNEVLQLEKLLDKIFDEALAAEAENADGSNLIEFPLVQELISLQTESVSETLDFSPTSFAADDPVLETDLTRFTPSIIERDDVDYAEMTAMIEAQKEQLVNLRAELKQKDLIIRSQAVDLASKDDQLKYMPELFDKALQLTNMQSANALLTNDLVVERLLNEELNGELLQAKEDLAAINSHMLVKFGRAVGLIV